MYSIGDAPRYRLEMAQSDEQTSSIMQELQEGEYSEGGQCSLRVSSLLPLFWRSETTTGQPNQ